MTSIEGSAHRKSLLADWTRWVKDRRIVGTIFGITDRRSEGDHAHRYKSITSMRVIAMEGEITTRSGSGSHEVIERWRV